MGLVPQGCFGRTAGVRRRFAKWSSPRSHRLRGSRRATNRSPDRTRSVRGCASLPLLPWRQRVLREPPWQVASCRPRWRELVARPHARPPCEPARPSGSRHCVLSRSAALSAPALGLHLLPDAEAQRRSRVVPSLAPLHVVANSTLQIVVDLACLLVCLTTIRITRERSESGWSAGQTARLPWAGIPLRPGSFSQPA